MSSPSGDGTDQILRQLSARCYIDNNRIARLERQFKLDFQLYVFAFLALAFAIAITMILVRATWHLWNSGT
jgi:hypothetical protein